MPFKSKAQRAWMYKNNPKLAEKWEKETSKDSSLPDRVKKKKRSNKPKEISFLTKNIFRA
tara:strand:+ start:2411 stop:2590 length:180 start_codon:yes stop_codon:yes gene_type:complete